MVVVMQEGASEGQIEHVVARLVEMGMDVHKSTGVSRTVLGAVGPTDVASFTIISHPICAPGMCTEDHDHDPGAADAGADGG